MPLSLQLFLEAFASAQLMPLSSRPLFFALREFGVNNLLVPALISALGATAGQAVNWLWGRLLLIARDRGQLAVAERYYAPLQKEARTRLLPLLLFTWIDFGALLMLAAGFLRVPLKRALPVVLVGQAGYCLYCVLS